MEWSLAARLARYSSLRLRQGGLGWVPASVQPRRSDPPRAEAPDGCTSSVGRFAILNRVVEQGGDRLVLVGAVVEGDRAGAQEMTQVRDGRALADLGRMDLGRGGQRLDIRSLYCHGALEAAIRARRLRLSSGSPSRGQLTSRPAEKSVERRLGPAFPPDLARHHLVMVLPYAGV